MPRPPKAPPSPEPDTDDGSQDGARAEPAPRTSWLNRCLVNGDYRGFRPGVRLEVARDDGHGESVVGTLLSNDLPRAAEVVWRKWRDGTYRIRERDNRKQIVAQATLRIAPDADFGDPPSRELGALPPPAYAPASSPGDLALAKVAEGFARALSGMADANAKILESALSVRDAKGSPLDGVKETLEIIALARGETPASTGSTLFDLLRDAIPETLGLLRAVVSKGGPATVPPTDGEEPAPALPPAGQRRETAILLALVGDNLGRVASAFLEQAPAEDAARFVRKWAPAPVTAAVRRM